MNNMQKELLAIGKTGCYFLSVMYLSYDIYCNHLRRNITDFTPDGLCEGTSILRLFRDGVKKGWCTDECYMLRPDEMMAALLAIDDVTVQVRHESLTYLPKQNEYEITRYEKGSWAHFVCTKNGKVTYDPYGYNEKDLGRPVSKRIFTVTEK